MIANCYEELKEAVLYSSANGRNGSIIVEEYMTGKEISVEIIVVDYEPHVLQITAKDTTLAPHFVEIGHTQPCILPKNEIAQICNLAKRAVHAIGINTGPAHVEIMLTKDGPKMIELGARLGGDCIATHLVPLSTGIDMVRAAIEISLGMKADITPKLCKGSAIRYFNAKPGIIKNISGIDAAKNINGIKEVILTQKVGSAVKKIENSADRVGFVIAQANSAEEAKEKCIDAMDCISIYTEDVIN